MSLQHSSVYNRFKEANKKENNNPDTIEFFGNSDTTRKSIIAWYTELMVLIKNWSEKIDASEKNKTLSDIHNLVTKVLLKTKNTKYFEARLLYMQIEKALINAGISPTNIKAAMEDINIKDTENN